jgi:uncharacterized membrane protein YbhN (UPF0104 family)
MRLPSRTAVRQWIREQSKVQVVLPVVVALGMLAYVSSIAVAPRSGSQLWVIIQRTWLPILILTFPYLAARALVWHELLSQLCLPIPWRQLVASFATGEMTKSLPAGVYTQNYVLGRLANFSKISNVRAGMATTAMLGLETALAVPVVLIVGIPGQPWLFWTVLGIVAAWIVVLALVWLVLNYWASRLNPDRHTSLSNFVQLATEFLEAGGELLAIRTLRSLIPTAAYMLIYVIDLFLIIRAAGVHNVSFVHTMAIYGVIVLAVVLIPIPTEIGITEFTGLGALLAYGVPGSTAAIIMLSLRILATGMTVLVSGILLFLMRDELRQAEIRRREATGDEATAYP